MVVNDTIICMWIRGRGRSISLEAESIGHAAKNTVTVNTSKRK